MAAMWPSVGAPSGVVHAIVCGSRKWTDQKTVARWLEALRERYSLLTIIEGAAPGADECAKFWADRKRDLGVHPIRIRARWSEYPESMRWKAGHDRNQVMCDMLLAAREQRDHGVIVVAFKALLDPALFAQPPTESKGGTEDMIKRAWKHSIPVWHTGDTNAPRLLPPPLTLFEAS